jgi:hypothetical protein
MTTDPSEIKDLETSHPELHVLELVYTQETRDAIETLFREMFKDTDSFHAYGAETLTREESRLIALNLGFITVSSNNDINHSLGPRLNDDRTLQCCHKWWRRGRELHGPLSTCNPSLKKRVPGL